MARVTTFTTMMDAHVLLTAEEVQELETSPLVADLRRFSLVVLTYTPDQILERLRESAIARDGLMDGLKIAEQYVVCAAAHLKLVKARLLIAAGAYHQEVLGGCND